MGRTQYHVTPNGPGGWHVTLAGSQVPLATVGTQKEAIVMATTLAKGARPSQVVIHRPNGRIREEHTYGNDPKRYPG